MLSAVKKLGSKSGASMVRRRIPELAIAARRRFLNEGTLPEADIPLPILRSWKRSAELGLDMEAKPDVGRLPGPGIARGAGAQRNTGASGARGTGRAVLAMQARLAAWSS